MPLQQTSGNDTSDAYGGGVAAVPNYIESVFSTYLYTGTHASLTINQTAPLYKNNWLIWIKDRTAASNHVLTDSVSTGPGFYLSSNTTSAYTTDAGSITSVSYSAPTSSFSLGTSNVTNASGDNFVSYSFAAKPKFFDVVTYTGTGSATTIAHNLGSVPGCIIVKQTSATSNWRVYHVGMTSAAYTMQLNQANAQSSQPSIWNSTAPTSTVFSVGADISVNDIGQTYVAYLFAHNAGGFGLTGTDNVISCGSFTTDGSGNATVSLGYEPQWVLYKSSDNANSWAMFDTMRGMPVGTTDQRLLANTSGAEVAVGSNVIDPTATGFNIFGETASANFIYIAIRRGPMKVPTDATKVFAPVTQNGGGTVTTNFPVDLVFDGIRNLTAGKLVWDRLRGGTAYLYTNATNAEATSTGYAFDSNVGFKDNNASATYSWIYWNFRRAPSFFDEVCYTGNGTFGRTINHNLGVAPGMVIIKKRSSASASEWLTYTDQLSLGTWLELDSSNAAFTDTSLFPTAPTATQLSVGTYSGINGSSQTYVAYLFATCAGVSKVGSYTGNGTTQTINCGFTGGARFVLVKATSTTGNWVVVDTARGMVAGTDPYLNLNTTSAEVNANNIYTTTGGFQLVSSDANTNANGVSYIFLAVA